MFREFDEAVELARLQGRAVEVVHRPFYDEDGWWAVVLLDGKRCQWRWLEELEAWL